MSPSSWEDLLGQLGNSGNFYRIKEGSTKLRLVQLPSMKVKKGESFVFWGEATTSYRGNQRSRFVIPALVLEGKGTREGMDTNVTTVVVPKTVLKGILGLLAEGYELFDPKEGYGLMIKRTGSGLNTDYTVLPSRNPQPLPADVVIQKDLTLDGMAAEFQTWANRPRQGEGGGGAESSEESDDLSDY